MPLGGQSVIMKSYIYTMHTVVYWGFLVVDYEVLGDEGNPGLIRSTRVSANVAPETRRRETGAGFIYTGIRGLATGNVVATWLRVGLAGFASLEVYM